MSQLTPRGRGGVALVRVAGEGAEAFLRSAFKGSHGSQLPSVGVPALGTIVDSEGATVDEVLLIRVAEDAFELGCHGGPGVVQRVLEVCEATGATSEGAHEAEAALASTQTELGCRVLLGQRERLPAALAEATNAIRADPQRGALLLTKLLDTARFGLALTSPPTVALVGRPNGGKSSIMNRLLGRQRVIVAAEPGTTRDAIEDTAVVDGVPVRLLDTAGRRKTNSALEAAGIERGTEAAASAACTLIVLDVAESSSAVAGLPPASLREQVTIVVLNKRDLVDDAALEAAHARFSSPALAISAKTGEGLDELRSALRKALVGDVDESGPVLYLSSQVACVEEALKALTAGEPEQAGEILASFPPGLTP